MFLKPIHMKSKLFAFVSTVVLLLALAPESNAQTTSTFQYFLPQVFPRSPNATAIEKYGSYQVNEFTGIPDISIPLYTIEVGGFKVPISLSYHASGIKITEAASWAGLGWSIMGGGQISRRTMGLPDDHIYGYLYGHMRPLGSYSKTTSDGVHYLDSAASTLCDTRPDIYSYDFSGHNGKFFFDGSPGQNYKPKFVPFAPLKLIHGPGKSLDNFTITDEHGNIYKFGGTGAIDTTITETEGTNQQTTGSAWKIASMTSQDRRDTVSYTYQADEAHPPTSDTEIFTMIDNCVASPISFYAPSYTSSPRTIGNFVDTEEKLLQQINFKNGKVVFEVDTARQDLPGARRLKDIKVYRYNYGLKQMELQKSIVFYHSYSSGSKRLLLDSIQIQDKAGSIMQHYRFDYNKTFDMPDYLSRAQDFWGYYNGCDGIPHKTANTMLTPLMRVQYNPGTPTYINIGQADRAPDSNYMQAYVLTGIHYPTGGYSTFTYQTNQYDTSGVKALAGGLRIHTISSYDGINPTPIVKTYVYNKARANFFLDYSFFRTNQTHRHYTFQRISCDEDAYATFTSFSSTPHCDLEAWDAATVVYQNVTEYIGTPGTNIGRTDYIFTDQQDSYADASFAGSLVYFSSFYLRGHLQGKKEYIHKSDGSYQPVQLTTNTYTAFPQTEHNDVGLAVKKSNYNEGCAGNPIEPGTASPQDDAPSFSTPSPIYYAIVSDDNYLISTTTHVYDTNDTTKYTTSTVTVQYDDTTHQQIAKTTHVDSKGNTHITVNKYAYNYLSGTTTYNAVLDSMISRNMYAEVVEKWDSVKDVAASFNAITGAQLNQFKTGFLAGSMVPSRISTLKVSQPLTDFSPSTVSSGSLTSDSRYVQMISFDQYDAQNNIIQYTPRNATPTAILWDYQSELPVAQVKNATTGTSATQVAYTSFEADGKGNWYYAGTPVYNSSAPTGTMVYALSSGTITSPSLPSGTAYVLSFWINGGHAGVHGIDSLSGTLITTANGWSQYEYPIPSGTAQVTISGTSAIDELRLYPAAAQMTTYAYDPSGVRSITDIKGMNDYFVYDYAQRLADNKDYLGNIINHYNYHYYDQNTGNDLESVAVFRNTCPTNTTPGSLTYTVPANKYYSSTKASANADALYDANTNGQILANSNCGCVSNITVTVSNTTSDGYAINFSGHGNPSYTYNFLYPTIQVPTGTYDVIIYPTGTYNNHTFNLTGQASQTGVPRASFNSVNVTSSPPMTLSIQ
jgi:hypothetical protein